MKIASKAELLLSLPFRSGGTLKVGLASKALGKTQQFQEVHNERGSSCRFLLIVLIFLN